MVVGFLSDMLVIPGVLGEIGKSSAPDGKSSLSAAIRVANRAPDQMCLGCHDVHDQPGESVPSTKLLRVSDKASLGTPGGLCPTCHIKEARQGTGVVPAGPHQASSSRIWYIE